MILKVLFFIGKGDNTFVLHIIQPTYRCIFWHIYTQVYIIYRVLSGNISSFIIFVDRSLPLNDVNSQIKWNTSNMHYVTIHLFGGPIRLVFYVYFIPSITQLIIICDELNQGWQIICIYFVQNTAQKYEQNNFCMVYPLSHCCLIICHLFHVHSEDKCEASKIQKKNTCETI